MKIKEINKELDKVPALIVDISRYLNKQEARMVKIHEDAIQPCGGCPGCHFVIARYSNSGKEISFCPFCGQAVKWE